MNAYRKEDCMSTKNPGGNRRGGTDAMPNDPMGYMKMTPEHGYLGHFRNPKFLREGHNTIVTPDYQRPIVEPAGGYQTPPPAPTVAVAPGFQTPPPAAPTVAPGLQTPPATPSTVLTGTPRQMQRDFEHPVAAAARAGRIAIRNARKSGGDVAAARAASQQAQAAARYNPQSDFMEAAARREARLQRRFSRGNAAAAAGTGLAL